MVEVVLWATALWKHSQSSPIRSPVSEGSRITFSDIIIAALSSLHSCVSTIHRGNRFSFLEQSVFINILKDEEVEQTSRSEQAVFYKTAVLKLKYKTLQINTEFRKK